MYPPPRPIFLPLKEDEHWGRHDVQLPVHRQVPRPRHALGMRGIHAHARADGETHAVNYIYNTMNCLYAH